MRNKPVSIGLAALLAAAALSPATAADRITGRGFATRSEVIAQHGMVATSHPLATQIGIDILKAGGSAVDAAIAANAALGLMEPISNGIGGDLFAIVWDPETKKLYGLNGSGRSPFSLTFEELKSRGLESMVSRSPRSSPTTGLQAFARSASSRTSPRSTRSTAAPRARVRSSAIRTSPTLSSASARKAATPSTRAPWPAPSRPT